MIVVMDLMVIVTALIFFMVIVVLVIGHRDHDRGRDGGDHIYGDGAHNYSRNDASCLDDNRDHNGDDFDDMDS
jgi:hypothetical protein